MRAERGAEEGGIEPHVAASRRGGCVRQAECALAPLLGAVVLRPSSDTMQDPSCGGARVHLRAPSAGRGAHWSSWATHLRRRASAYTHESRRGSRRLCSSGGSRTCATPSSMPSATVATCSTPTRLRPCSMLSAPPPASWSMAASITSTSPMGQHRSAPLSFVTARRQLPPESARLSPRWADKPGAPAAQRRVTVRGHAEGRAAMPGGSFVTDLPSDPCASLRPS